MRPYLAIITDSFHAAFASRLLWIVLGSILLLLAALAPIGYHEVYTVEFSPADIHSSDRLTGLLAAAMANDRETAAGRVAEALPEELREEIRQTAAGEARGPRRGRYADAFNALLASEPDDSHIPLDDPWYDAKLWAGTPRIGELRALDERPAEELSDQLRQRRSRLRLEAALPGAFRPRPERSLAITYAGLETPAVLAVSRQRFIDLLNQFVFPIALYYLLGVGAVFVGVLVTAPIIPEMLQPGSLHLLLSKPVSRPGLYLSKFVGGCAFVLLSVALLVSGMWLITGFRLGIWNHRLLYCIPIFVFLFAVYYSVSALAALRWRSAIVSVVLTVLFWFACFSVGLTAAMFDTLVTDPAKVRGIARSGDSLLVSTASGGLLRLAPESDAYAPILASGFQNPHRILGPVELADGRIAAARIPQNPFNVFGSEDVHLMLLAESQDWEQQVGLRLPAGTRELRAAADGGLFAAGAGGIFYASGDSLLIPADAPEEPPAGGLLGGIQRLLGETASGFERITPPSVPLAPPAAFATVPGSEALVVYSHGRLLRLRAGRPSAPWQITAERDIGGDLTLDVQLGATAERIVLARRGEPLRVFTSDELEPLGEIPSPSSATIIALQASPVAEQLVAILSDQRAALLRFDAEPAGDAPRLELEFAAIPHQESIEAVAWDAAGTLWLAHDVDRLTAIKVASGEIRSDRHPDRDLWRLIDAWGVTPLRSIVPQTGELSEAVTAVISGREDLEIPAGGEVQREQLDVTRPLVTCGVFTAAMLLLGCLYIYRQDF
ncbi:ABC transporter permease [Candidatus Laterigemmans baculatus]|uniref:ABC transporter permease n=1 Tax=Candidatus Laterigemmans baculatus TaxID=2770505 RepID=UPI0013DAF30F|nr:ABC transporter permease [Candidatus Laterigemmans baculatus]